jgi:hypothetical protein
MRFGAPAPAGAVKVQLPQKELDRRADSSAQVTSMTSRKSLAWIGLLALAALLVWFAYRMRPESYAGPVASPERSEPSVAKDEPAERAPVQPVAGAGPVTTRPGQPARDLATAVVVPLPEPNAQAPQRVWVRAQYGDDPESLGIFRPPPDSDGEARPPQGFTPTRDGKLLVLDSAKQRLVWFDREGRMERTLPLSGLVMPADVAVAKDGTIVVVDHEGVQTAGTVLIDASGRIKGKFPQFADGMMSELYTVGNDVYFALEGGLTSVKAGETNGAASDETPGVYDQNGKVPGVVAPDGRTVLSTGIHDQHKGQFWVSAIDGEPPKHLFTRLYAVEPRLLGIPYMQADARGTVYVVLYHRDQLTLVCLDGKTGEPIGRVPLPSAAGRRSGTPFRTYNVVQSGGIVQQQRSAEGSTYQWFDCR